ncbi:MAG: S-adenosylmethionine decarboxylase [Latescibacteria bacterium DG_63]|nr:MAG: S-adenosylmethionine decarboxylase [Latescibacteria bacterium DG_63]
MESVPRHGTIGHHYVVEGSGCDPSIIGSVEKVQQILARAAEIANTKIWSISFHRFPPYGVSGVVVISESHLSVHTWPEAHYVALDIYTCGRDAKPEDAVDYAMKEFGATEMHTTEITRGLEEEEEGERIFFHSIVTWEEELPERKTKVKRRSKR